MRNGNREGDRRIFVATIGDIGALQEEVLVRYERAGVPGANRAVVTRFDFESEESWSCLAKLPEGVGEFYWGLDDLGFIGAEFRHSVPSCRRVWLPFHPFYCWIRNRVQERWYGNRHFGLVRALREERINGDTKCFNSILGFEERLADLGPFFSGDIRLCWELALEGFALYRKALDEITSSDDSAVLRFCEQWETAAPWEKLIFPFHYFQGTRLGGGTTQNAILRHRGRQSLSKRRSR